MNKAEEISSKDHLNPENYQQFVHTEGRTVKWGVWPEMTCPACNAEKLSGVGAPGKLVPGIAYASQCTRCGKFFDYGIAVSELRMP